MKALIVGENQLLTFEELELPIPKKGEVRVKLKTAAINKRDYWISVGKYPSIKTGVALGSDGAGIVDQVGEEVSKTWLGRSVIINPNVNWGENNDVQSKEYKILGMPSNGTFAEYLTVGADRLVDLPLHLTFEEAASLPLAGLTAYRSCFHHSKVAKEKKVLISGFGGGVAHFAFLFARAVGARVSITSGREGNLTKAIDLGAENAFNYNEEDWIQQASLKAGGFDIIIDSAGGDQFNNLINLLNPAGKVVFYGASNGLPTNLNLYKLFWKQGSIQGSTMGSDKEFIEMVEFVEHHGIKPLISSLYSFDQVDKAIAQMEKPGVPGKTVIAF